MYMGGGSFLRKFGQQALRRAITPIDITRKNAGLAGLGAITISQGNGPKPTVNPNAVVKLAK